MPSVYISEYAGLTPSANSGYGQIPLEPPLAEYVITVGAEFKGPLINPKTRLIRIHTDAICSVLIGPSPTATVTSGRLGAGQTEFRGIPANTGVTYRVSVIANT